MDCLTEALPQCRLFGWTRADVWWLASESCAFLSDRSGECSGSTKEEGRSAGGCERDSPPPASSMCAREALSVPGSAPTQRTCQLFRSPFSLEAELKNKLQLMGVLKRSVTSCSAYFFVPCFTGGGKEVGTRGMALLLSIKVHVAKARHSQFEGKTACCCDCQSVLHLTHVTPEVP